MLPGTAVRIVAESGLLLKSVITEQELFVMLDPPRLAPLIPQRVTRDRPKLASYDTADGCNTSIP